MKKIIISENIFESLTSDAILSIKGHDSRGKAIKRLAGERQLKKFFGDVKNSNVPYYFKPQQRVPIEFKLFSIHEPDVSGLKTFKQYYEADHVNGVITDDSGAFEMEQNISKFGALQDLKLVFTFSFATEGNKFLRIYYHILQDKMMISNDLGYGLEYSVSTARNVVNLFNRARAYFMDIFPNTNMSPKSKITVKSFPLFHDSELEDMKK